MDIGHKYSYVPLIYYLHANNLFAPTCNVPNKITSLLFQVPRKLVRHILSAGGTVVRLVAETAGSVVQGFLGVAGGFAELVRDVV